MQERYPRRVFLTQALLTTGGALLVASCTGAEPSNKAGRSTTGLALPDIESGTVVTDPSQFPTKFSESPEFAKLVSEGKLPPVAERIGQDPLVIKPLHEIGKYGGEIRRGYIGVSDFQNANRFCSGPDNLLYWDFRRQNVIPNIARAYELSGDSKVLTLHLRRGMRWSDGHPFTADDIIFWREDVNLNPDLSPGSTSLRVLGQNVKVTKVDDVTVQYISPVPNPLLPQLLAGWTDIGGQAQWGPTGGGGYAPKHYLSKFHPKYTSQTAVNRLAAAAGFKDWSTFFLHQNDWSLNTELPLLTPWIVTRPINKSPWTFAANPYSIWVDVEGNQLPYIPKIIMRDAGRPEILNLRAVAGDYDFQDRKLPLASLPVLLKNQQRSKYTIHRTPSRTYMDVLVRLNLAYDKDRVIGDLIRTTDFRRALSLAIDRNQINQTFLLGTSIPTATVPADDIPYFPGPEWRTRWATFDPAQANQLLDKIGLTERDSAGYRLRPDGKGRIKLNNDSEAGFVDYPAIAEMIKRQWKSIGIDLNTGTLDSTLGIQRIFANEMMLQVTGGDANDPLLKADNVLPTNNVQGVIGIPYAKWFESDGKAGVEPPESLQVLKEAMDLRRRGLTTSEADRTSVRKRIYQLHADQVWSVGILGFGMTIYGFYLAKNNLGNVPARVINNELVKNPINALPMTFYYK